MRVASNNPAFVLGYVDEVWWSRFAQPRFHSWVGESDEPLRLVQRERGKDEREPQALACYGLLRKDTGEVKVRFLTERPVAEITILFLAWVLEELQREGKRALFLVWDNASWHISQQVQGWLREHNRKAKQEGGVRLIRCQLPTQSPWLNPIEPHWRHGKRAICEPDGELTAEVGEQRVCDYFNSERLPKLSKKVP